MANPDELDFDDEGDHDEPAVSLGFAIEPESSASLLRNQFPSKLGGAPAWLDPIRLPTESELQCPESGLHLRFLMQVYAAVNDDPRAFHRAIYLFISPQGSALGRPGAVRAFRSQLPRENAFYAYEPPDEEERPKRLNTVDSRTAALRNPRWAPRARADDGDAVDSASAVQLAFYPELELVVEPEPEAEEVAPSAGAHAEKLMNDYKAAVAAGDVPAQDDAASAGGDPSADAIRPASAPPAGGLAAQAAAVGGDEGAPAVDQERDDFSDFTARVARAPDQCLRYVFDEAARPLWASRLRRTPMPVPPCNLCGGPR